MAGNRLLPRTVYKGGKKSTRTVGFHDFYYTSKRANVKQIRVLQKYRALCQVPHAGLDISGRPGYNKSTRRCPLVTGTSPWWKPDGCHYIQFKEFESFLSITCDPSVAADGSLLSVVRIAQIQHERHNAGDGA